MIDALAIRAALLNQRHDLRLHALAAVEERRTRVHHANFSGGQATTMHQPVCCREHHRRRVLILTTHQMVVGEMPACLQAGAAGVGLHS